MCSPNRTNRELQRQNDFLFCFFLHVLSFAGNIIRIFLVLSCLGIFVYDIKSISYFCLKGHQRNVLQITYSYLDMGFHCNFHILCYCHYSRSHQTVEKDLNKFCSWLLHHPHMIYYTCPRKTILSSCRQLKMNKLFHCRYLSLFTYGTFSIWISNIFRDGTYCVLSQRMSYFTHFLTASMMYWLASPPWVC